ncbi:KH domain-containing protein [Candidatus Beckwithbacteria bacterium]|nr:KH domain-containing protein [Candidatus Beckwithbacteria bacterium]
MATEIVESLQKICKDLLEKLEIKGKITIEQGDERYLVNFEAEETGMLIGYHGENIEAIQVVLTQMIYHQTKQWIRIDVNVGDYWQKREEKLKAMADRAVEEVLFSNKSCTMPEMTSKERRIVHLYLKEKVEVKTESVGEGEARRLVIFPQ